MIVISHVVALSNNNVIGVNNDLPWILKKDLAHFKEYTTNKIIVMGRKTFESIGRPLPNRLNFVVSKTIKDIDKDLIYLVPTGSKMQEAAKKLDMKIACEIFADRNYEDDGNLVSRKKKHALITDPEQAQKHVLKMVKTQENI